jgi:hypothetical protein
MQYRLTETTVTITGTVNFTRDRFDGDVERVDASTRVATIALGLRGDPTSEARRDVIVGSGLADDDFTMETSGDGRLLAVSYKSVGIGAQVTTSVAKVVAFVGGIAASLIKAGGALAADEPKAKTAEELARAEWEASNSDQLALQASGRELLKSANSQLFKTRKEVVTASDAKASSAALTRAARIQQVVDETRKDLDRIDQLYKAWRGTTKSSRTLSFSYEIALAELPLAQSEVPPAIKSLSPASKAAWDNLGVIVGLGNPTIGSARGAAVDRFDEPQPDVVYWRQPRVVRVWIWKRGADEQPALDRTFPAVVLDELSYLAGVRLNAALFGERSGSLTFGEQGTPTKIVRADKSAIGAFAAALSEVPASVTAGLESASKAQTTFTGLLDAADERKLTAIKRRVDALNKELELKGLEATADLFDELKVLEQQVAIADAEGKLKPPSEPSELDRLKTKLEFEETRSKLEAVRRQSEMDSELADARSEIARLEARVKIIELKSESAPKSPNGSNAKPVTAKKG